MTRVEVGRIVIGDRDREDFGDIDGLARSIQSVGLLHPVVVTADYHLVAGGRRLAAVTQLGWRDVPVTVVDLATVEDVLRAEADENTCRKDLSPVEAAKARLRRAAVLKSIAPQGRPPVGQKRPQVGDISKAAAIGTGYSGTTLDKVDKVRAIAADPDETPAVREVAEQALGEMERTGAVDGAYRDVVSVKNDDTVRRLTDVIDERQPDAAADRDRLAVRARMSRDVKAIADLVLINTDAAAQAITSDPACYPAWQLTFRNLATWATRLDAALTPSGLRAVGDE